MGTGSDFHAVSSRQPDHLPGRGDGGAAGNGPVPTRAPSPAAPLSPCMQAGLEEIRRHWGDAYAVAACVLGRRETWTAIRLDGGAHFTSGTAAGITALIRGDYIACPVRRVEGIARDYLLERLRAQHPGWAIASVDTGLVAVRGSRVLGPLQQGALRVQLEDIAYQGARDAAIGDRHPRRAAGC